MSFKIGMRTIKTTIGIAICAALMKYVFNVSPFFACIGSLVAVDNSVGSSLKSIATRNIATITGGVVGIILGTLSNNVIFLSIGVIFVITFLSDTKYQKAIIPGCIVYLAVVYLNIDQGAFDYGIRRIFETMVGSCIGFLVNITIRSPHKNKEIQQDN